MLGGWYYDVPPATGPPLAHPRLPGLLRPLQVGARCQGQPPFRLRDPGDQV